MNPTEKASIPTMGSRFADWVLFAGLVARAMGHSFLLVALPPLGRLFGFGDLQTGLLLSFGALGMLVAAPAWGVVAEKKGRRPVLLIALGAATIAAAAYGFLVQSGVRDLFLPTTLFLLFIAARSVQAFGAAGIMPAAQAWIADSTSTRGRAGGMGFMGAAFGLGGILGAALLFSITGAGVHLGFYLIAGITALTLVLAFFHLREPEVELTPGSPSAGFNLKGISPCLVVTFVGVLVYGVLQQVTGLRLQDDFQFEPLQAASRAGGVMMTMAISMVLAQGIAMRFLRIRPERLVGIGAILGASALVLLALAGDLRILTLGMGVLGFSLGLTLPANLAVMSLRTGNDAQGKIAGINGTAQGLAMVAGPALGAALFQQSSETPYWVISSMLLIAGVGFSFAVKKQSL
ncbi:MAG: MFS transporter [Verrucomicrobiota bacterium]